MVCTSTIKEAIVAVGSESGCGESSGTFDLFGVDGTQSRVQSAALCPNGSLYRGLLGTLGKGGRSIKCVLGWEHVMFELYLFDDRMKHSHGGGNARGSRL